MSGARTVTGRSARSCANSMLPLVADARCTRNVGQSDVDHFVVTDADLGALAKPVQHALEAGERRVGIAPGTAACGAATGPKVFHGVAVHGRPVIRRNGSSGEMAMSAGPGRPERSGARPRPTGCAPAQTGGVARPPFPGTQGRRSFGGQNRSFCRVRTWLPRGFWSTRRSANHGGDGASEAGHEV